MRRRDFIASMGVVSVLPRAAWSRQSTCEGASDLACSGDIPLGYDDARFSGNAVSNALKLSPNGAVSNKGRAMAEAVGVSLRSVQRVWTAHGLAPHRVRTFKLSKDKRFIEKFADVVGLYIDPPAHAIVLSVDEKSQIQALDRTQPGLPMKKGRAGTMTHDYKRHGTTTLFAALMFWRARCIGRCMQRHRHQEFIRFLNAIEADVPAERLST